MIPQDSNEETDGAVALPQLVRLLARFKKFASCRRETANYWHAKGDTHTASQSDSIAEHYERCATELERTIKGETPADPGHDWPICETNS